MANNEVCSNLSSMNDDSLLARRRRELHALGKSLFGKRWNVARHCIVGELTGYQTDSSQELSLVQLEVLIANLRQRKLVDAIRRGAEVPE